MLQYLRGTVDARGKHAIGQGLAFKMDRRTIRVESGIALHPTGKIH